MSCGGVVGGLAGLRGAAAGGSADRAGPVVGGCVESPKGEVLM